jgi:acyl-coenzyme A synthetase/AMP-(fatty) acid ligase
MNLNSAGLPLLSSSTGRVAWWRGQPVSSEVFLAHVKQVARGLLQRRFAVNLCEDRYLFMVAFAAVITQDQTNLLPPSRVKREIQGIIDTYPNNFCITNDDIKKQLMAGNLNHPQAVPEIAADHLAAIVFTSGSTGRAQPNPKQWGSLVKGAWLAQRRFGFGREAGATLVATVPPQHMYGLETSIIVPLITGLSVHSGRPFFPEDIRELLAAVPAPRILITTPAHLRVCTKANIHWPPLAFIISATAPLSTTLAAQTEQVFAAPVFEIYGFTEAGSIASRRTVDGDLWRLYEGLRISEGCVYGPHLPAPVRLNDRIELHGEATFKLVGRQQDFVNIAGKRTSLSHLNRVLNEIEGVEDGVFVMSDDSGQGTTRLVALVVAPPLSEQYILAALAECVDAVFLPRPLFKVAHLPRNETGKLPRSALLKLLNTLKKSSADQC